MFGKRNQAVAEKPPEKTFAEKLGCKDVFPNDFWLSAYDDDQGNLYISTRGFDDADRLGYILESKRAWEKQFPQRKIVAQTSMYSWIGIESRLDGMLCHYEIRST